MAREEGRKARRKGGWKDGMMKGREDERMNDATLSRCHYFVAGFGAKPGKHPGKNQVQ